MHSCRWREIFPQTLSVLPLTNPFTHYIWCTSHQISWKHSPIMHHTQIQAYRWGPRCANIKSLTHKRNYLLNYIYYLACTNGSHRKQKSYLEIIRNLIYRWNSGGKELFTPLLNLIAFRHLEPHHYQKVLDRYEVVYLDCSSNKLYAIEMYITLIDNLRGIIKSSAPTDAATSSISDRRRKNPTPPPRG